MIITCPQCDIRFVVPSTIFMRGPRKLRCSSCKHTWLAEEPLERNEDPISPVDIDEGSKENYFVERIKQDFMQGYKVIGGVFLLVILGFGIYKMMSPQLIVGQGLAFDNITVERVGSTINVKGKIVNAMDSDRGVPSVQITRILAEDVEGDITLISPGKTVLHSGESIEINESIEDETATVQVLKITFKAVHDVRH